MKILPLYFVFNVKLLLLYRVNSYSTKLKCVCPLKYRISGIFRVGLIFAEFVTSLKSPNIDPAKNKPFYTSSLRALEIAKIGLSKNLTHLRSFIFAKITRREKFPIYGTYYQKKKFIVRYLHFVCNRSVLKLKYKR